MSAPAMLPLLQVADPQLPPTSFGVWLLFTIIKLLIIFTVYMVGVAMLTLAERKICAWMQDRHGPNRVGPWGLLQPAADGLKNIMKEETQPAAANRVFFNLAPALAFLPAMCTWAVIPFAAPLPTRWGRFDLILADLPIGFLFILALTSIGVYGIVLAGWSSNNKYSLLGGLRSSAQMISYEISMGMATIPVLILAGNVTLGAVVLQQSRIGWNALTASLAAIFFIVSAFAETNRLPFDLPEAESELVAGYHAEYSSMKFSMFMIAEYANMTTASALIATLFFGGWDIPFTQWDNLAPFTAVKFVLTLIVMSMKIAFFIFLFMWIRWTLPRFRYDQLMALGWKIMLPLLIGYVIVIAGATLALDATGVPHDWRYGLSLFALNIVVLIGVFFFLDRGRVVSPASTRARADELARLREVSRRRARLATPVAAPVAATQPTSTTGI